MAKERSAETGETEATAEVEPPQVDSAGVYEISVEDFEARKPPSPPTPHSGKR